MKFPGANIDSKNNPPKNKREKVGMNSEEKVGTEPGRDGAMSAREMGRLLF